MIGKTNATKINIIEYILDIPSEYQPVEYIESDGLSYINTLLHSHSNMSAEIKFEFTTVPNDGCLVGCRHTSQLEGVDKNRLYFYHYFQGHKLGYGMYLGKGTAEANKVYHVKTRLDQGHLYMYVDGKLAYEGFDSHYIANNHECFYIFALNDGDNPVATEAVLLNRAITFYTKAKLYYCKIWDGDLLVRYFIPVKHIDTEEPGLYDLIGRHFYGNSGYGQFSVGLDIDLIISNNGRV